MATILQGFCYGFGGTIGVVFAIFTVVILGIIIIGIKKASIRKRDLPKIILDYRKYLLKKDRYEEYMLINKYEKQLKNREMPKELADKYELDIDSYICWVSDEDGDGKLTYKFSNKLRSKINLAPKKEDKKAAEPKSDASDSKPSDNQMDKNSDSESDK